MFVDCLHPSRGETATSSPRRDVQLRIPLSVLCPLPLILTRCMVSMFLPSGPTSCGALRSAGTTPLLRYDPCGPYRAPSLHRCPPTRLLLRWQSYFATTPLDLGVLREEPLVSGVSPGCPSFSSFGSIRPETPGGRSNSRPNESLRFVCACYDRIDNSPPL